GDMGQLCTKPGESPAPQLQPHGNRYSCARLLHIHPNPNPGPTLNAVKIPLKAASKITRVRQHPDTEPAYLPPAWSRHQLPPKRCARGCAARLIFGLLFCTLGSGGLIVSGLLRLPPLTRIFA